jgi:hypothetical protein
MADAASGRTAIVVSGEEGMGQAVKTQFVIAEVISMVSTLVSSPCVPLTPETGSVEIMRLRGQNIRLIHHQFRVHRVLTMMCTPYAICK